MLKYNMNLHLYNTQQFWRSATLYKVPLLQLNNNYNLIPVNAIDCIVEFKPRRVHEDQFYVYTSVEE